MVEALLSRRKAKKDLEYEVKWWGLPSNPRHNKWFVRSKCAHSSRLPHITHRCSAFDQPLAWPTLTLGHAGDGQMALWVSW